MGGGAEYVGVPTGDASPRGDGTEYVGVTTGGGGGERPPFESVTHVKALSTVDQALSSSVIPLYFGDVILDTLGEYLPGTVGSGSSFKAGEDGWYNIGGSLRFAGTSLPQNGIYVFQIYDDLATQSLADFNESAGALSNYYITTEFYYTLFLNADDIIKIRAAAAGSGSPVFAGAYALKSNVVIDRII